MFDNYNIKPDGSVPKLLSVIQVTAILFYKMATNMKAEVGLVSYSPET